MYKLVLIALFIQHMYYISLNQQVEEIAAVSLDQPRYHLHMNGPSTNCYLSTKMEICAECNLIRQPGGGADIKQNGKPARLIFKKLTPAIA